VRRPLLLLDVDGVISLFGFDWSRRPAGKLLLVDGIPHLISATAGHHLRTLSGVYELAWCTGWEEKADEYLPPVLGLEAPIPHMKFLGEADTGHWKLSAIDGYAGAERALAWLDDGHNDACKGWAAARPGPTLLLSTDPAIGITEVHVAELLAWAQRILRQDDPGGAAAEISHPAGGRPE
jgi:hypothetical protein